jgi:hypothetical protein
MVKEALDASASPRSTAPAVPAAVPHNLPTLLREVSLKVAFALNPEPTVNDVLALF